MVNFPQLSVCVCVCVTPQVRSIMEDPLLHLTALPFALLLTHTNTPTHTPTHLFFNCMDTAWDHSSRETHKSPHFMYKITLNPHCA